MTRGRGGVRIPPKNDDVIYEQPLIIVIDILNMLKYEEWITLMAEEEEEEK